MFTIMRALLTLSVVLAYGQCAFAVAAYGQCGGTGYTGDVVCDPGSECVAVSAGGMFD
jgi:hypothetical protein